MGEIRSLLYPEAVLLHPRPRDFPGTAFNFIFTPILNTQHPILHNSDGLLSNNEFIKQRKATVRLLLLVPLGMYDRAKL